MFARPAERAWPLAKRPSRRLILSLPLAGILIATGTVCAASRVAVGGAFKLRTPDGRTVTDQTYRGKWLLVYFGYTSCPDSCPTALFEIAMALKKLGPDAAVVQAIFVTIDPKRDTPDVVGPYVQSFDRRIIGLIGSQTEIDVATKAYGAYAVRRDGDAQTYQFDHSSYIYLMNPQGAFVRGFDQDWAGDRIAAKIREIKAASNFANKI